MLNIYDTGTNFMALEQSSKEIIDNLSIIQLEEEQNKGRFSKFQNDNFNYVTVRLAKLVREQQDNNISKTHNLAEQANEIANNTKDVAKRSYNLSVLSIFVSIAAIVITIIQKYFP